MLQDLIQSFHRLFFRRKWEELAAADYERELDLFEFLERVLGLTLEARGPRSLVLLSAAGRRVTLKRPNLAGWPDRVTLTFEHGLGCRVACRRKARAGAPEPMLRVGGLAFYGRPPAVLRAASLDVLDELVHVLRDGEVLDDQTLELTVPHANNAFEFVDRLRSLLTLADDIEVRSDSDVLAERLATPGDASWTNCGLSALGALDPDDPALPDLLWALMVASPEHASTAATLNPALARARLHRAVDEGDQVQLAAGVLASLPPSADTARRLREHLDIALAVRLLTRGDGFLAAEANERLDDGFLRPPDRDLLRRIVAAAEGADPAMRQRMLGRVAPHVDRLTPQERTPILEAVLRNGPAGVALGLSAVVVASSLGPGGVIGRHDAAFLLPLLPEGPSTDDALRPVVAQAASSNDLAYAITERILSGRSLALVPVFAAVAGSLPRPAADDLVAGIVGQYLDGAGPVLIGFLDHPDPDIVHLALDGLGTVGGHRELMALGQRASEGKLRGSLEDAFRAAMESIEARLGPLQRGGLSLVGEGGGDLALVGSEGAVAIEEIGGLTLDD